jgi:phage gp45-like
MPSKIQVDSISTDQNTAPTLTQGATIPSGKTISGTGGMTVNGTLTGTFSGDGSALTGVTFATKGKTIGIFLVGG